jgi:hypothetical protein
MGGTELCMVGFVGKNIAALEKSSDRFVINFAQVIELHDCNEKATKRAKQQK